jgi:hypothetical protein
MRGRAGIDDGGGAASRVWSTPHPTRFAGHLLPQGEKEFTRP